MADIVVTAANVSEVYPQKADVYSRNAAATITAGQVVYLTSAGAVNLADGSAAGTAQGHGIALNGGGAGQAIRVLRRGHVYGYTLSQAYDAELFISDTAGALADAAGTVAAAVGRVDVINDKDLTKVAYFDFNFGAKFA